MENGNNDAVVLTFMGQIMEELDLLEEIADAVANHLGVHPNNVNSEAIERARAVTASLQKLRDKICR
jgi:hypothetical protein